MESKVIWRGGTSFTGTSDSGFTIPLGTEPGTESSNHGARPMELFAIGLAGCTAMDVISILLKKGMEVIHFEVQAHIDRATEHPRVFTHAGLDYIISGHQVDEIAVLRAIELSTTRYCPAYAMFNQVFPIDIKYQIYEELTEGGRSMVASGAFTPQGS